MGRSRNLQKFTGRIIEYIHKSESKRKDIYSHFSPFAGGAEYRFSPANPMQKSGQWIFGSGQGESEMLKEGPAE
jgi:hypothetical protein